MNKFPFKSNPPYIPDPYVIPKQKQKSNEMKTPEEMAEEYIRAFRGDKVALGGKIGLSACRLSYLAGYKAAQPQWISVKERLPESTPMVLAMCSDGYELAYYGNYGKDQWTNTLGTENLNVTHWMLLPTPPKEEK